MIADHYIITDFGCFKPGEKIPEEKKPEVVNGEGAAEAVPVETPKPTRRRKKAN